MQDGYAQEIVIDSIYSLPTYQNTKSTIDCFLATSFFIYENWRGANNYFFILSGSLNLAFKKIKVHTIRINELRSEINYQKFIDSSWVKNSDNIFLSSIWILNKKEGFKNSYSVSFKTQLTNTWEPSYQIPGSRILKSGPFLPFTFVAGYGIHRTFWKNSYVNISFASIKINSIPRTEEAVKENKYFATTNKMIFKSEYGLNIQSVINRNISKFVTWENKVSCFTTVFNRNSLIFDIQNRVSVKLNRFLKIKLVYTLDYDIIISEKLQTKYELLVGLSLEK